MTLLAAIEQVVEATEGSGLSEELEQSFCSVALFGIMRTIERVAIFCFLLNAGLYIFQHPRPFVVDRPYNEAVLITVAEYIVMLQKPYKIFAVAKYASFFEYKAKCLLSFCLFHIE